jgi:peptidoglycan biosynthesis protein MviN/MurJ (putative lipid II flippase)
MLISRVALACAGMYVVLYQLYRPLEWWIQTSFTGRVGWLAVTIIAGVGTYFVALLLMGTRLSQFRLKAD